MSISHERRWELNFDTIKQFIKTNKCLPSKYRIEEHQMLNWIKYNKKLIAQGKLAPERQKKFEKLMAEATVFHKLNQYAYTSGKSTLTKKKENSQELSLF